MRKKYIGYGISILLICLIVGVLIWFQIGRNRNRKEQVSVETSTGTGISLKEYPDEIPVANWNGLDKMYRICNTKMKDNLTTITCCLIMTTGMFLQRNVVIRNMRMTTIGPIYQRLFN